MNDDDADDCETMAFALLWINLYSPYPFSLHLVEGGKTFMKSRSKQRNSGLLSLFTVQHLLRKRAELKHTYSSE